ncbi:hypothetical protein GQ53DRAFT_235941 [Thozetella sp. PMI_491]|nr:hypothetical protein GQ53DRAFT_235941 [Thozetella sp. PMI_491]
MSLVDLPPREAGHSSQGPQATNTYNNEQPRPTYPSDEDYAESIYDEFYDMEDQEPHKMAAAATARPQKTLATDDAPALPQRSALRASRLLEGLSILKMEATELGGATTPHDVYLSSEEDASSSADDFSDYDCDSASDGVLSPSRSSHEVTARVVSVVYSGKPSIVDLSLRRRSLSPSSSRSAETHSRTSSSSSKATTASTSTAAERPLSIASSISSVLHASPKKADHLLRKRPPFLNLDPFANGSTYSLELPASEEPTPTQANTAAPKPPKTPTQQLMKGVTRTFSLVRKKSRPMLSTNNAYLQSRENLSGASPLRTASPQLQPPSEQRTTSTHQPQPPLSPAVTYNDIIRAARKNSVMLPPQPELREQDNRAAEPESPTEAASTPAKRGILSGLAARRRSFKFTGKALH